ncbi:hypothetical protein L0F63_000430 [Massospora cicadina]|nr:hypothetical protein L0F63_000430 [Massospora cicadina]
MSGRSQSYPKKTFILAISNLNGDFDRLKVLVQKHRPAAILHTGNFRVHKGSLNRLNERTLQTLVQNSTVIPPERKKLLLSYPSKLFRSEVLVEDLSGLVRYASGESRFSVPIYTTHGSLDDIVVLEGLKAHPIENLHFVHDGEAPVIDCGSTSIRLLGLGGYFLRNKLFDHGCGSGTLAGGEEGSWATLLQFGNLIATSRECESPNEVRILMTHTDPATEPLLGQLASAVKADYLISSNNGGSCPSAYTQSSIHPNFNDYCSRLEESHKHFSALYDAVRPYYEKHLEQGHLRLVSLAEKAIFQFPPKRGSGLANDDWFYQNTLHYSLCEASRGHLLLIGSGSQVWTELTSYGLNFEHRVRAKKEAKVEVISRERNPVSWIRADNSDQSPRQVIKALSNGLYSQPPPTQPPAEPKQEQPSADRPVTPVSATSQDNQDGGGNWADSPEETSRWEEAKQTEHDSWASEPPSTAQGSGHLINGFPPVISDQEVDGALGAWPTHVTMVQDRKLTPLSFAAFWEEPGGVSLPQPSPVESEFANAWGIEFVICDKGDWPSSLDRARGRLVYVHPGREFEPRTCINELFYDLQPEIVRIFVIANDYFIFVEIKDPDQLVSFSNELSSRVYRGYKVVSNPKRDPRAGAEATAAIPTDLIATSTPAVGIGTIKALEDLTTAVNISHPRFTLELFWLLGHKSLIKLDGFLAFNFGVSSSPFQMPRILTA